MLQLDVNEVVSIDNTNSSKRETLIDHEFSLCSSYPQKSRRIKVGSLRMKVIEKN